MTTKAKHLIEEFAALPDASKREVLRELLRICRDSQSPGMSNDELTSAARDVLVPYDGREGKPWLALAGSLSGEAGRELARALRDEFGRDEIDV